MLVTDKFVFVHLPRSGGTFVSEVIRKFFPSVRELGHHMPREYLPREYSQLPVLGTVRNPWDFYVSWYHYVLPKAVAAPFVSWMNNNGSLGFEGAIQNLVNIAVETPKTPGLMDILPEQIDYSKRHIPTITTQAMRAVLGTGIGYYSFRFNELFGDPRDMFICKVESLRVDLVHFFEKLGIASDEMRDYILGSDKKNSSEHSHYSTYYTPGLADVVLVRDHSLIARFNYRFEPDQASLTSTKRSERRLTV